MARQFWTLLVAICCFGSVAAEEIRLRDRGAWRTFERLPALQSVDGGIYLYEKGAKRTEYSRRRITERIWVHLTPGTEAGKIASATGSNTGAELSYAPGHFIFRAASANETLGLAARLRRQPGVIAAHPILARKLKPRYIPNDPLFTNQWHLLNIGQQGGTSGADIHVTNVWERFRGAGITVGVIDDGVLYTHPDLSASVDLTRSIDIRDGDPDPRPEGFPGADAFGDPFADSHGTAVAGIIAAQADNGIGIAGIAYEAKLAAVRLLGPDSGDDQEAEALGLDWFEISNNSWGAEDDGETLGGAGDLALKAIETGARNGRGGKGIIYIFAGGNGGELEDNANYDTYVNSIYTIGVGAVTDRGRKATYSERGACLIVSAPAGNDGFRFQGITTTDLLGSYGYNRPSSGSPLLPELPDKDYTQFFSGTSAAAPMVSGVAALVLEANPEIGWRDMQEILLRSATQAEPSDREWITNGAGLKFNPKFGGGMLNAAAAVDLALSWSNLPPQTNLVLSLSNVDLTVTAGSDGVELPFEVSSDLRVEHVTLQVDIQVAARGALSIDLESPSGTISPLAEAHGDPNPDYDFTFMSVFHWGENPSGTWKARIADTGYFELDPNISTLVRSATLTLYGAARNGSPEIILEPVRFDSAGFHFLLSGAPGRRYQLQRTRDFLHWEPLGTFLLMTSTLEILDPEPPPVSAFYRVLLVPD